MAPVLDRRPSALLVQIISLLLTGSVSPPALLTRSLLRVPASHVIQTAQVARAPHLTNVQAARPAVLSSPMDDACLHAVGRSSSTQLPQRARHVIRAVRAVRDLVRVTVWHARAPVRCYVQERVLLRTAGDLRALFRVSEFVFRNSSRSPHPLEPAHRLSPQ